MKIALFPGSFDPITLGHENIIHRALPLFDKIIIGIGINSEKKSLFPIEHRIQFIEQCLGNNPKLEICSYDDLTGKFCQKNGIKFLIRGIRNSIDFQYENDIARANKEIFGIETIFFATDGECAHISSSLVREIYCNGGEYQRYIPKNVILR